MYFKFGKERLACKDRSCNMLRQGHVCCSSRRTASGSSGLRPRYDSGASLCLDVALFTLICRERLP